MKFNYYILLFFIPLSNLFGQQINVTTWTFNISSAYGFYIDDNDNIVLYCDDGIFIYDDSVLIQQVSTEDEAVAKGRFGNILFSAGNHGITSWTPNGSFTYPGDSSYFIRSPRSMIQLSDGRILTENGAGNGFAILDSSGITILPVANLNIGYYAPMIEINPDLYLFGYNGFKWSDTLAYLDRITNTITKMASSELIGSRYILGFDNSEGEKIFMHYQDGIIEVENNTVNNIEYFALSGISISQFPLQTAFTSIPGNKYVLIDTNYFMIYSDGNLTYFDSGSGWNLENTMYIHADAASDGTVYLAESTKMYKITSPLLASNESEIEGRKTIIYPNPSNGSFKINADYSSGSRHISVFDFQGKILFKKDILHENDEIYLPGSLANGIYILVLSGLNDDVSIQSKLIIDRD